MIAATQSSTALRIVGLITPLGQLWLNAIRMTVVPLVVSLLFVAVAETDTSAGLGRLAGVTLGTFLALLAFAAVVALLLGPPLIADMKLSPETAALLRLSATADAGEKVAQASRLVGFGSWITALVPPNAVKAASDGTMLPASAQQGNQAVPKRTAAPAAGKAAQPTPAPADPKAVRARQEADAQAHSRLSSP